jgi:histidine triad (HIT) family protein
MDCVFCGIVAGEEPARIVDETAETLAFAPLDPLAPGHLLVVPKAHHESLFDVPDDVLAAVTGHARDLARDLCGGDHGFDGANLFNDSTSYQAVPHLHLHVVGRRAADPDLFPETDYHGDREEAYAPVTAALAAAGGRESTASAEGEH